MHLGYLDAANRGAFPSTSRRSFLLGAGASLAAAGLGSATRAADRVRGFKGEGPMNMSTGEDWIDTFFTGGADAIVHYYADEFVFEDVTLFQTIDNKEDLYRAFLPFNDEGPDSPAGVHQFDVIRYDGGPAGTHRGVQRAAAPANYSPELWSVWSADALRGADSDYDEWGVMNWVWKAKHNMDFLGMPATGKTTHTRGITFHMYRERKVVREFTFWNFRDVAIQLGAAEPQVKFWLPQPKSKEVGHE